ncbi:hypothetical protein NDU88_003819 [Pleurodeles waltl]|uniref:Ig-like domain-containing protein n=1 Tax=Pleurodeles waltl TaxID=8319 RepID=A0AAV7QGI6_PLEWA|nr:hypothetical protein NDU88_003819 [Pleurodeles waltl]
MSPVCLILCALLSASCVRSQVVLIQTGSEMKKPGESVKLKCEGTGFTMSNTWMNWVRQAPGKGLEWLVYYHGPNDKYYNSAIQDRFTASKDNSNVYLQMDRLKAEDTANYYCARGTVQQKRLSSAQEPAMQFRICPVSGTRLLNVFVHGGLSFTGIIVERSEGVRK